jgi:hypothetical protein
LEAKKKELKGSTDQVEAWEEIGERIYEVTATEERTHVLNVLLGEANVHHIGLPLLPRLGTAPAPPGGSPQPAGGEGADVEPLSLPEVVREQWDTEEEECEYGEFVEEELVEERQAPSVSYYERTDVQEDPLSISNQLKNLVNVILNDSRTPWQERGNCVLDLIDKIQAKLPRSEKLLTGDLPDCTKELIALRTEMNTYAPRDPEEKESAVWGLLKSRIEACLTSTFAFGQEHKGQLDADARQEKITRELAEYSAQYEEPLAPAWLGEDDLRRGLGKTREQMRDLQLRRHEEKAEEELHGEEE